MISHTETAYLKTAKNQTSLSDHRCKIGAVLVKQHKIISIGHNTDSKTNPIQAKVDTEYFNEPCCGKIHAETMALLPFIKSKQTCDLSRATLYVYRVKANGNIGLARPCPRCMTLIKSLGIRKIVYSTNDGIAKETLIY